mgnify:CR=1 FL=1
MSKESFVKGAAILSIAGLLVKVLGAVYRIPLTNLISSDLLWEITKELTRYIRYQGGVCF